MQKSIQEIKILLNNFIKKFTEKYNFLKKNNKKILKKYKNFPIENQ